MNEELLPEKSLLGEIRTLIEQSRHQVAVSVNSTMTLLYWQVGNRINQEVLKEKRAEYGKKVVSTLGQQLVEEYGRSFSEKNLRRMMQFADVFADHETVVSLIRQLSWTHILAIIPIEDPLKRAFYIEMTTSPSCRPEKSCWTNCTRR
jgi:hypothetical protein